MRFITILTLISCIACGEHESAIDSSNQEMNQTNNHSVNEVTPRSLRTEQFAQTIVQNEHPPSSRVFQGDLPSATQQKEKNLESYLRPTYWSTTSGSWPNEITDDDQAETENEAAQSEDNHGGYFVGLVAQDPKSQQLMDGLASGQLHLQGTVIRRSKGIIDWNYGRGVGLGYTDWVSQSTTEDALVLVIEDSNETEWYLGFSLNGVTRIEEGSNIEVTYIAAANSATGVEELEVRVNGALRMTALQGYGIDLSEQGIKLQAGEKITGPTSGQPCEGSHHALHLSQRGKEVRLMPGQSHTVDAQSVTFGQWTQSARKQGCEEDEATIRIAVGY